MSKALVQDFIDHEINNLFYGPGDEFRVAVLGAFDTWPYMDLICRILSKKGYISITSRYVYHKFRNTIIRFPTTNIKQYASEQYQMKRLLKKIIQNCLLTIINYSVSAAHYIETDWCSEQENLKMIGIAYVRNTFKANNCEYLMIKTLPQSKSYYSICEVKVRELNWKAWDCINVDKFCPFIQQDISKNILEYYFTNSENSKLICVENLEDLSNILEVIFKNIKNIKPLDGKYQETFEETISKIEKNAHVIEFLFNNNGLECLVFLKMSWIILNEFLEGNEVTSNLMDLFQIIKKLREYSFVSLDMNEIIRNLTTYEKEEQILNKIFIEKNENFYWSLSAIISIKKILFGTFGEIIINNLKENDFIKNNDIFWYLTNKSFKLLDKLNLNGNNLIQLLIDEHREAKSKFNDKFAVEGLKYAIEKPEFFTHNHIKDLETIIEISKHKESSFLIGMFGEKEEDIESLIKSEDYEKILDIFNEYLEKHPKDSKIFFYIGLTLIRQKKFSQLIEVLNKALEIDEFNLELIIYKGIALDESGKYEEALEQFDQAIEIEPNNEHALFHKGMTLITLKRFQKVIDFCNKIILNNPKNINAIVIKGIALRHLNKYEKALDYFNKALEIDPTDLNALVNEGILLSKLERYEEAIHIFDKSIELRPEITIGYTNKGIVLEKLNKYDDALDYFNKALEIDATNVNALVNKGILLSKLERYEEAIQIFDKSIELRPEITIGYTNKGIVLEKLNKYDDALDYFNKALEIDATNVNALVNKGILLSKLERYEEAIQIFDKLIKIHPNSIIGYKNKGFVLKELEKCKEALDHFDKALEIEPKDKIVLLNKGLVLEILGKYEQAIKSYDRILEIESKDDHILYHKAKVLEKLKKYNEAIKYFDEALKIDPTNIRNKIAKGIVLYKLNKFDEADKIFHEIIKLEPENANILYNLACLEAIRNNKENSLNLLKRAIDNDKSYIDSARKDSDFENIKNLKEFKKLIAR